MCRTSSVRNTCRAATATSLDKIGQPRANQSTFPLSFRTCSGTSFLSFRPFPCHFDEGGISPRHARQPPVIPGLTRNLLFVISTKEESPSVTLSSALLRVPTQHMLSKKPVFPLCLNPCILWLVFYILWLFVMLSLHLPDGSQGHISYKITTQIPLFHLTPSSFNPQLPSPNSHISTLTSHFLHFVSHL